MGKDDYFDQNRFLSAQYAQTYDEYSGHIVIRERVFLDKVKEKMPEFFGWLQSSGWMCFLKELITTNHTIVAKFYANFFKTNFGEEMVTMIRGVRVNFSLNHYQMLSMSCRMLTIECIERDFERLAFSGW